jgi:hypothetical protein
MSRVASSPGKYCKRFLTPDGCPHDDERVCGYSHDPERIRKYTKACATKEPKGCKYRLPANAPAGALCDVHYKKEKDAQYKAIGAQIAAAKSKIPCKREFRTSSGCEYGAKCQFSHDRQAIKDNRRQYDCKIEECRVLAGPVVCESCLDDRQDQCRLLPEKTCVDLPRYAYCQEHAQAYKAAKAEADEQAKLERLKETKGCKYEWRSQRGCMRGEDECIFSHNRDVIQKQYRLSDCDEPADKNGHVCMWLAAEGETTCSYHLYKRVKDAEFAMEREIAACNKAQYESLPLRNCNGPNCQYNSHPAKVRLGFCEENGCLQLVKEFTPSNETLLLFGRGKCEAVSVGSA